MAPSAQALTTVQACTPPNPDAWVNACVTLSPASRTLNYVVPDQNGPTEEVCPVNKLCVDVPVILRLIKPWSYTVAYYSVQPTYNVNLGNVVDDVCGVIGIVCYLAEVSTETASAPALPHGMTFEGVTLDANGSLAGAVFLLPDGEAIVLPIK